MKSTGIVRKLDSLGRVVLPIELRRVYGLEEGEGAVEIFVDGTGIIIRKYVPQLAVDDSISKLADAIEKQYGDSALVAISDDLVKIKNKLEARR